MASKQENFNNHIKLSVIITTRNRLQTLGAALSSLKNQTLPPEQFEVIIIDNGSIDDTKFLIQSFVRNSSNMFYFFDDRPGLHVGRNRGLFEAKTEILVYSDDDIEASPMWLEGISEAFQDKQVALVGGKNLPKFESNPPLWLKSMWEKKNTEGNMIGYLSVLDFGDKIKEISPFYVFGCNFSIRKQILLSAGGFHPDSMPQELIRFRGDGETYVSRYIFENDYKTLYHPKASVYHWIPKERMTEAYFCRRAFNQGISDSYAQIRNGETKRTSKIISQMIRKTIRSTFRNKLDRKIQKAYHEGLRYHQEEVRKDPSLYEWIMKKNYID